MFTYLGHEENFRKKIIQIQVVKILFLSLICALPPGISVVRDRKPMTNSSIISIYSGINRCNGPYHKRINHLLWKYLWLSLMIGTLRYRNTQGEV